MSECARSLDILVSQFGAEDTVRIIGFLAVLLWEAGKAFMRVLIWFFRKGVESVNGSC